MFVRTRRTPTLPRTPAHTYVTGIVRRVTVPASPVQSKKDSEHEDVSGMKSRMGEFCQTEGAKGVTQLGHELTAGATESLSASNAEGS